MRYTWTKVTFLPTVIDLAARFFHTNRASWIFGKVSRLMMLEPFGMDGFSILIPFRGLSSRSSWMLSVRLAVAVHSSASMKLHCHDVIGFR